MSNGNHHNRSKISLIQMWLRWRRPAFLAWARRYARHPRRVFWILDATTGRWREI